jgi:type I restriction enzyme S subunit
MAMSEWRETLLGSFCDRVLTGGTPDTTVKAYYEGGTIPWVKTKEVNYRPILTTDSYITQEGLDNSSAKMIPQNSIIVAMYGQGDTAGRVAVNKIPVCTNQACCNLVIDASKADYRFIYYVLFGSYDELVALKSGSAQPNLNTSLIKGLQITAPDVEEQRVIAEVLSSLDDKIDLLTRQNATLEALAQTYFRQWFVEEASEKWEEKGLDEIANFLNGLPLQNYPCITGEPLYVIKIKELNSGYSDSSDICSPNMPEKYIVNLGDVIFSWSGSLIVDLWKYDKGVLNQHLFKVTSDKYPKWFYYYWIKYHLPEFQVIAESKATTMGHIQRGHLTDAKVIVPSDEEIINMDKIMQPLIAKMEWNNAQNLILQKLRDTLLPKLISGKIRIK